MNINKKIDKILKYKTYSIRNKIDSLLKIVTEEINCNLNTDSTSKKIKKAIQNRKTIYNAIKTLDFNTGERFLKLMDK